STPSNTAVKIMCPRTWKVFGKGPRVFLQQVFLFSICSVDCRKIVYHQHSGAGVKFFGKITFICFFPYCRSAFHGRMLSVNHSYGECLKFGMPRESTSQHHFKPFPITFGTSNGMDAYKTATCFNISSKG